MLATLVILTRDRPDDLRQTLDSLAELPLEGCELVVVDNASDPPARVPKRVGTMAARLVRLEENRGAAGRTAGAEVASGRWLLMLDDDSAPVDAGFLEMLKTAPADVAAIGGDIRLPDGSREVGGLPEVIVGCGAAIDREAYLAVGGYDAGFVFYAEEYDLCAKLIARGGRIEHDARLRVLHRKTPHGRDIGGIVRRLVRNEGVVAHRHAPDHELEGTRARWLDRRRRVAEREGVMDAFVAGLADLEEALRTEPRRPLEPEQWERFMGLAAARRAIERAQERYKFATAAKVMPEGSAPGKGAEEIGRALRERGVAIADRREAEVWVVGTLAPGVAADGVARLREEAGGRRLISCPEVRYLSNELIGS